jgi:hypothetical protein
MSISSRENKQAPTPEKPILAQVLDNVSSRLDQLETGLEDAKVAFQEQFVKLLRRIQTLESVGTEFKGELEPELNPEHTETGTWNWAAAQSSEFNQRIRLDSWSADSYIFFDHSAKSWRWNGNAPVGMMQLESFRSLDGWKLHYATATQPTGPPRNDLVPVIENRYKALSALAEASIKLIELVEDTISIEVNLQDDRGEEVYGVFASAVREWKTEKDK